MTTGCKVDHNSCWFPTNLCCVLGNGELIKFSGDQ